MRTWTIKLAALAALAVVGLAVAQPPAKPDPKPAPAKPDPNSLEAAVATALKNNADIKHAEAKVSEAAAGLDKQTRLQVMQAVATAHGALQAARSVLGLTEANFENTAKLHQSGGSSNFEVQKAELDVKRAKADVATAEAQLALLLGKTPGQADGWLGQLNAVHSGNVIGLAFSPDGHQLWAMESSGAVRLWDAKTGRLLGEPVKPAAGSMDARIREALTKPVKIENWKEPLPVGDVIEYLKKKAGADVPFRLLAENPQTQRVPRTVELMNGELPLSAWLAVIEDSSAGLVFVVREYGILVTTKDRMPDDGVRVREFLRRTEPKKDEAKKP